MARHPRRRRSAASLIAVASASATSSTPSARASPPRSCVGRARELGSASCCWELPHDVGDDRRGRLRRGHAAGRLQVRPLQEPSRRRRPAGPSSSRSRATTTSRGRDPRATSSRSTRTPRATCRTRPSNDLTPLRLAERAAELAAEIEGLTVRGARPRRDRRPRDGRVRRRRAGLARGAALIVLRYDGRGRRPGARRSSARRSPSTPAASRSSPRAKMQEMKLDMSGGAAVIEATAAIARLGLPGAAAGVIGADREHARRATPSSPATSSAPRTARRSRSTTPTPRAG